MQWYVERLLTEELKRYIVTNPVTAIIGPRQCGKSTLVHHVLADRNDALFLDLELPSDTRKLADPESQRDRKKLNSCSIPWLADSALVAENVATFHPVHYG
jgi:predicted AAA+ superfamily ATPase